VYPEDLPSQSKDGVWLLVVYEQVGGDSDDLASQGDGTLDGLAVVLEHLEHVLGPFVEVLHRVRLDAIDEVTKEVTMSMMSSFR